MTELGLKALNAKVGSRNVVSRPTWLSRRMYLNNRNMYTLAYLDDAIYLCTATLAKAVHNLYCRYHYHKSYNCIKNSSL